MGGERIVRAVRANDPVTPEVYDVWTGEWEGDFLGFNPAGVKEYDIHVRHVWDPAKTTSTREGTYIVQPVHMVHVNQAGALIFEQAFNVVNKNDLFCVLFNEKEGTVPFVGYSVSPGHFLWVREGFLFSERIYNLIGRKRLYHIHGFSMESGREEEFSELRWMEGWYYGPSPL